MPSTDPSLLFQLPAGQVSSLASHPTWKPPSHKGCGITRRSPGGHQGPGPCRSAAQGPASPSSPGTGRDTRAPTRRDTSCLHRLSPLSPKELDSSCHPLQKPSWTTRLAEFPSLGSHSPPERPLSCPSPLHFLTVGSQLPPAPDTDVPLAKGRGHGSSSSKDPGPCLRPGAAVTINVCLLNE